MGLIWGWLTSKLAGPIGFGLAAVLIGALVMQGLTLSGVRRDLKKASAQAEAHALNLATCRGNTTELQTALDRQGRALAALKEQSDAWVAEGARQVSAARAVAESRRRHAEAILEARPGADLCKSADDLILTEAGR